MKSQFLKLCSMVLVFALLLNLFPVQAIALELDETETESTSEEISSEESTTEEYNAESATIIAEIPEKRTAFTKDYKLSNGFNMSVVYPEVVHYEDDGQWKEIDNTLKASGSGANGVYMNTAGGWHAIFPQQLTKNNRVSVAKNEYAVSFGMAGELRSDAELMAENGQMSRSLTATEEVTVTQMQSATAQVAEETSSEELAEMEHPEIVQEKLHSRLTYEDVYSNVDVVYDLNGYQLKESIVINSYDSSLRGYQYVLETGTLTPVLNDDGSIDLFAPETEDAIMQMPAPYMVDSAGAVSYDVDISLVPQNGSYLLTYRMPTSWLADTARVWPVVLDPAVIAYSHRDNILDQFVAEYYSESYTGGALYCGYYPDFGKMRSFLQYVNLPTLTSADIVVHAELSLQYLGGNSTTTAIEAHKVNTAWHSQTITWANQPAYNETVEDFANISSNTRYRWIITDVVRDWYASENTGVMLKASDSVEAGPTNNWKKFYSIDYDRYEPSIWPYLNIVYRNANGLESYWDYTATSAGRAGTGYVNNYTGNLTWVRSDLGFGGNRMPVSISHVYNSSEAQVNAFGLGYGWRTNYNQTVSAVSIVDDANNELTTNGNYVWTDGDGTKHYFVTDPETGKLIDEDGLELTLTVNETESPKFVITDKQNNKSCFDERGRLIKLINNQISDENNQQQETDDLKTPSEIIINYQGTTNRIAQIRDGAGRFYNFVYTNDLLTRIRYTGKGTTELAYVAFAYTGSTLRIITDEDGKSSAFGYDDDHLLTCVVDVDTDVDVNANTDITNYSGYRLNYTYSTIDEDSDNVNPRRVVMIEESEEDLGSSTPGGMLTITYTQNQTTLVDYPGNVQIIQFNDWGNVVSVQDNQGRAEFAQYARVKYGETEGKANQLTLSSKMQNTVGNMLKDSSFENGTLWNVSSSAVTRAISTEAAYHGSKSLKLVRAADGNGAGVYSSYFTLEGGETCTFSAYVKTGGGSVYLVLSDDTTPIISQTLVANSDWTRMEVSFTNTTSAAKRLRAWMMTTKAGVTYMDCAQVEVACAPSRYNLIENGDFRYSGSPAYGWTASGLSATDKLITNIVNNNPESAAPELDATVLKIIGSPTSAKTLSQTLNISGAEGDCYVLGGWANGDSVPLGEVNGVTREFGLKLIFNNTDSTKTEQYVSFNCDLPSGGNWQYAATPAVATKAYSSITVQLVYSYNANTVYFDGIQLFKEQFGSSYTYDEETGDIVGVEDLQKQKTQYTYDEISGDLETVKQLIGDVWVTKMTYEYDAYHNVTKATTSKGVVYEFTYDTYGNNTSVSIVNGTTKITSSATYSTDGNRLVTTKDALDKTTTYGYNENTNVLEWVKYPNDTDATRTEYSYDTMFRLASSSVDLDPNTTLSVSYTYTDDLLTKIQTNSTIYNFAYGAFSQRTGVYVGTQALATYTYTDNQNRWLASIVYGGEEAEGEESHSDKVTYSYDGQGRVTEEVYYEDGGETPSRTISYAYDNSGALATVTDSKTGRTTRYYYDLTDRMMKYVESGDGYSHSVGYEYDTLNNLTHLVETINGVKHATQYGYDDDNRVVYIINGINDGTVNQEARRDYTYDSFGRVTQRVTKQNDTQLLTETISYVGNSTQVASITTVSDGYSVTYSYTYDNNGNISTVSDGTYCTQYFYDAANQLVRENNQAGGFTHVWVYDDAGNILTRTVYPYTTGEPGGAQDTFSYTYGDSNWGDLLTVYDGIAIDYDGIGNPLNDGTWEYLWEQGRQLVSMYAEDIGGEANDVTIEYTYDANGMRVGKTVTKRNYHQHSYTVTIVPPTCTEDGYTWYECDCGDTYHDDVTPATGHSHVSTVVAPTCTEDGYTLHVCACGVSYQTDSTAALGHNYSESIIVDSDTQAQYILYSCTRCDHSYMSHAHKFVTTVVAPTCAVEGYTLHECDCGYSYKSDYVDALGHSYLTITDLFTGIKQTVCTRCGLKAPPIDDPVLPPVNPPGVTTSYGLNPDEDRVLESTVVQEYSYVYNGGTLMQTVIETTVDDGTPVAETLSFSYDASGLPMSVVYNGTAYFYTVNLQGDVMAIVDATGNAVVSYAYDAWGNILSVTGTMADTLGESNPLRYRGYVYDQETSLYYLQSRYYDPEVGRFINADAFTSTGQGILGNNMFAYCLNNPTIYLDKNGDFAILTSMAIGLAVGIVSQFISGVVANAIAGKTGADLVKDTGTVGEYVTSALTGMICGIPGAGAVVSVICDVAAPAVQQGVDCLVYKDCEWSTEKYATDVMANLICDVALSTVSLDPPKYIRDIKDEARSLGKKGKKALEPYLNKVKDQTFLINQGFNVMGSVANEVYTAAFSKAISMF